MIVTEIVTGLLGAGKDWIDGVRERRKAKTEAETAVAKVEGEARARIIERAADNEANWDRIWSEGASTGWKDEYWTIVLSIPLVMCFIPGLDAYVERGFAALSRVPDWYFYCVMAAVAGAFGLRALTRIVRK